MQISKISMWLLIIWLNVGCPTVTGHPWLNLGMLGHQDTPRLPSMDAGLPFPYLKILCIFLSMPLSLSKVASVPSSAITVIFRKSLKVEARGKAHSLCLSFITSTLSCNSFRHFNFESINLDIVVIIFNTVNIFTKHTRVKLNLQ